MHKFFAKTQFIGKNVIYLPQCHSTNTEMQTFLKKNDFRGRNGRNGRFSNQRTWTIKRSMGKSKGEKYFNERLVKPHFSVFASTILFDNYPGFGYYRCAGSFHDLMM